MRERLKHHLSAALVGAAALPGALEARAELDREPLRPEIAVPAKRPDDDGPDRELEVDDAGGALVKPPAANVATNTLSTFVPADDVVVGGSVRKRPPQEEEWALPPLLNGK